MATDPHAEVLSRLRAIPGMTAHDGQVPDRLPEDGAGFIRPYVVLFGGLPRFLDEERGLDGLTPRGTESYDFQTNVVGATVAHARAAARMVRDALTDYRVGADSPLGGGRVKRNPDGFDSSVPFPDNTTTPVRYVLPLYWRAGLTV